MTTVLALTKYGGLAASARQRFLQFAPHLAASGLALEVVPLIPDDVLAARLAGRRTGAGEVLRAYGSRLRHLLRARRADVLWVQYELFPYLPALFDLTALPRGVPLVLDFDDAIFHQYDAHRSAVVRAVLGRKLDRLARRADLVICGNAYIEAWARRNGARTVRVPTVVDTGHFTPSRGARRGGLTVGWIGSPSTWSFVAPVLPAIAQTPASRFLAVGGGEAAGSAAGVESRPWSEASEVRLLQEMDIGIMPLDDTPFARGKCAYKLIQYMACGLPVVASPVGMNAEVVDHGVTGFLASTDKEWREALDTLAADPDLRRRMGEAGRRKAEAEYSLGRHGPRVAWILSGVAGAPAVTGQASGVSRDPKGLPAVAHPGGGASK